MINLIAFIICTMCAIYWGIVGNIGLVLFEVALALINVPFMLEWFRER